MRRVRLDQTGRPHVLEFCDNGAKATAWELTAKRASATFLKQHALRDLDALDDRALESFGRAD